MSSSAARASLFPATLLVVAALLAGCGSDGDDAAASPPSPPVVVLESDGIGLVVDADGGTIRHLRFGEARLEQSTTALARAQGEELGREEQAECGEGPLTAVRFRGITAYFAAETLVGWDSDGTELTTADGVGIGSTRAELDAARADLAVEESSLGLEWHAGDLSGTLTTEDAGGTVVDLWSGSTCIAR